MINDYFEDPRALERIRAGSVGPHIDSFTDSFSDGGYSPHTIRGYIRAAVHFSRWADRLGIDISTWDEITLVRFQRHLARCTCSKRNKGIFHGALAGVRLLLRHLRERQVIAISNQSPIVLPFTAILGRFAEWLQMHRGLAASTVHRYHGILRLFLTELGEDPSHYEVGKIRSFVIDHLGSLGRQGTRSAVTALRAYLRFLVAEGRIPPGFEYCVPTVPQWRLSSLPRYLEASDVERVVSSCDLTTGHGLRDHAILLLLARLGLRAGDIVRMTISDIDWQGGTLQLCGKGRREVLLPLPQEVGNAVLEYLERGRPRSDHNRVFLAVNAPTRPFASSASVSDIVRFALKRAGIDHPPSRGAHLLRHSAATAMLRAGASLDTIATVLRHQSPDTTAYYAKVDIAMLEMVIRPWPGGAAC